MVSDQGELGFGYDAASDWHGQTADHQDPRPRNVSSSHSDTHPAPPVTEGPPADAGLIVCASRSVEAALAASAQVKRRTRLLIRPWNGECENTCRSGSRAGRPRRNRD